MTHQDAAEREKSSNWLALASLGAGALACIACITPIGGIDSIVFAVAGLGLGLMGLTVAQIRGRGGALVPVIGLVVCALAAIPGHCLHPKSAAPQPAVAAPANGQIDAETKPPPTPGAGLRKAAVIGAEYIGYRMTDYGAPQFRFRLSNKTGKAIKSFRGSVIMIKPKTARPVLGLYLRCNQPMSAGGGVNVSGVWSLASKEEKQIKEQGKGLLIEFVARRITYQDGSSEEFDWPCGQPY